MVKNICQICNERPAKILRPRNHQKTCIQCFCTAFETEVHQFIIETKMFKPGEIVACGASGGKDSTVLAYVLSKLNTQYKYGLKLFLLSVDEGITGYRDDSLETVKRNQKQYNIPLKIVSYKDLYGWTMDQIVAELGKKNNCTFCGVFRRQALDRGAKSLKADVIATGHNADDIAETIMMNFLRGDIGRLGRCIDPRSTGLDSTGRCKPLMMAYEKEIVLYAHHKKLDYFVTECIYSPNAYRGYVRQALKDLERVRSTSIIDIIKSAQRFKFSAPKRSKTEVVGHCIKCNFSSSRKICKACILLHGLNTGRASQAIGRSSEKLNDEIEESYDTPKSTPKSKLTPIKVVNNN